MKKKILILVGAIIAILIISLFYIRSTNANPLKDENVLNIQKIEIFNTSEGYVITEQEDINVLFKLLKSIKLVKKEDINLDGIDYLINLTPHNGKPYVISIYSDNVRIKNRNYKSNKDYYDKITKVFDELSNKYPKIELGNVGM